MGFDEFVGKWKIEAVDDGNFENVCHVIEIASVDGGNDENESNGIEIAVSIVCTTNRDQHQYKLATYLPDPNASAPGTIVGPGYTIQLMRATPDQITDQITYKTDLHTGSWTANDTSGIG